MKYINFKRYKFYNILKRINLRKYNLSIFFKPIYARLYDLLRIYRHIDLKKYNLLRIYRRIDLKKYNFFKIYRYFVPRRFYISTIYKHFSFRRYTSFLSLFAAFVFLVAFIYLSIPIFFSYDKTKIENFICKDLEVKCLIKGKINYSFIPSPRIKIRDLLIEDPSKKRSIIAKIKNTAITISPSNLFNKKKFTYNKIKLLNAEINLDLNNFNEKVNLLFNKIYSRSVNLKKGIINFFDGETFVASIKDANFIYKTKKNKDELILKGKLLEDEIYFNLQSNNAEKNLSKIIIFKMSNLGLFTKVNIFNFDSEKKIFNGDILFKKNKNRITAILDYKDDKMTIKRANLRNVFLDGQFAGEVTFFPYFDFDLDVSLGGINFIKLSNFINNLSEKDKKNLFKINEKVNGKINLGTDKIYSKYNFINSFESQLKFINGNILIERFLFNLGKLGAADLTGIIKSEKNFTNLKFENNIFIDDMKRFYNKFGIYNKEEISSNLFIMGNFDLVNLSARFIEITAKEQFKGDDVAYIEKEFNEILLENGYVSLFDFLKLKEFIRLIIAEDDRATLG